MRRIAVISKPQKNELQILLPELVAWLRAKGFVRRLDGTFATVHVVGQRALVEPAPDWIEGPGRIVCIGLADQINRSAIEAAVEAAEDVGDRGCELGRALGEVLVSGGRQHRLVAVAQPGAVGHDTWSGDSWKTVPHPLVHWTDLPPSTVVP